jgi:hypothetical protein
MRSNVEKRFMLKLTRWRAVTIISAKVSVPTLNQAHNPHAETLCRSTLRHLIPVARSTLIALDRHLALSWHSIP